MVWADSRGGVRGDGVSDLVSSARRGRRRSLSLALLGIGSLLVGGALPLRAAPAPILAALAELEKAQAELRNLESSVRFKTSLAARSSEGKVSLEYGELRKRLRSGSLGDLRKLALFADDYVGDNVNGLEEKVWSTMPNETERSVKVPFGPNEVLCVVFSCFSDPRMKPSTDVLLTQKMLDEGLKMGMANDPRITPDTILTNIEDLSAKLSSYIGLVKGRAKV